MSYSPVFFPERRESLLRHFVRAVASINLHTIESAYHNVRYKVDYHLIHARLKYYSNSKNPRVIHTKLNNQRLFSLRTNPHDPYLVKPGEFLTMGSAGDEYNGETLDDLLHYYNRPRSLDIESCPPAFGDDDLHQAPDLLAPHIGGYGVIPNMAVTKNTNLAFVHGGSGIGVGGNGGKSQLACLKKGDNTAAHSADIVSSNAPTPKLKRILQQHPHVSAIQEETSDNVVDLPLDSLLPKYFLSSYSSPVTVALDDTYEKQPKKLGAGKSPTTGRDLGSPPEADSIYGHYAQYSNFLQVISPVESMSVFRNSSPKHTRASGHAHAENRADDKKVWQVVLSDISLSAARLSTGSEGTSREDYESLKGDLTHAKVKENTDCFAENMRQAKVKFYGHPPEGGKRKKDA